MKQVGNFSGVTNSFDTLVLRLLKAGATLSFARLGEISEDYYGQTGRGVHFKIRSGIRGCHIDSVSLVYLISFGKWSENTG